MKLGPSNPNNQPDMLGQNDAPTEMFQTANRPQGFPYQPAAGQPFNPGQRPTPNVRPEQLINKRKGQTIPPGPLHTKIAYLWRSDPAYKVLFIAIGAVILCSVIGLVLLGSVFANFGGRSATTASNQGNTQATAPTPQNTPAGATQPTATPTLQPTATPTLQATATPLPQATVAPTPTPVVNNGPLTAQFSGLPGQVNNHTTVDITVTTQPGATVTLLITYTASPAFQQTNAVVADANGTATIPWSINERAFSHFSMNATARLYAIARGQNQQATSQPATVQVNLGR
ncbi:hypothetical protein [Dictyobacter kobayashii]|uniref:Uncharacterized protein n=1 Tax=Dictyobacter kobayashii TaxID=2014872 RepID=A0A402AGM4_9CHLR|nr:hypothetical protein [Dictyobacter kobayashii]GCE18281.1 hypothetical protein KDK_20810 [Dictyobacter kobayashii]